MKPRYNKNLSANLPQYQLYSNCIKGGRYMRNPPANTYDPTQSGLTTLEGGTYLRPFPNESPEAFEVRRRRAAYRNHAAEVIRVYVATVFAQGSAIDRSEIISALGPEIAEDIDRRGTAIAAFVRKAFRGALQYGWMGCLTDLPRLASEPQTVAEERELGLRPYSRLIKPPDLWDWRRDSVTGDWLELLIFEGPRSEYEGKAVWSRWDIEHWEIGDAEGVVLAEGPHDFGRLPFDVLICDEADEDDDEPFGHSALRDIADLAVELFNNSSELEDLLKKTNFPFLHVQEDPEMVRKGAQGALPMGPDSVFMSKAPSQWIGPDTKAVDVCQRHGAELEEQIRRTGGVATRSEESVEARAAAALVWEYSTRHSLVKLRAESLRDWEVRLYRTYSRLLKRDIPAETVRYPSDYATLPVPQDITTLQALHDIGAPAEVQRAQLRSVVLKQFFHRPDLQRLLEAVNGWDPPPPAGLTSPPEPGQTETSDGAPEVDAEA